MPLSTRRPHHITRQGVEAGVYVRLGSTTRRADPALVAELERNARRHLEPLIEAGLVERAIPDKPTSRHQRYQVTDAGRHLAGRPRRSHRVSTK